MARVVLDGVGIEYELLGSEGAQAVALTPGGRFSMQAAGLKELGGLLADQGFRVLLWDRPNCGKSDLHFEGPGESAMQAQFLVKLIRTLDLGPTALWGGSAGARVSLLAAHADPQAISRLGLCWISGGLVSMMRLGSYYCCEPAEVAALQGMEAVTQMPIWQEQIAASARNRDYMLGFGRDAFIAKMEEWAWGFVPSRESPVGGLSREELKALTMPAMVLRGSADDLYHPAWVCEQVAELMPNARLVDPPWHLDIFADRMKDGTGLFSDWPMLAPLLDTFLRS